jgi:lysophospholipid acyltransferase (LPLAT)-like uncharacterized protein
VAIRDKALLRHVGDWLLLNMAPLAASWIIRLLHRLIRIDFVGEEHPRSLWQQGEPVIIAFWHDQLLLMVQGYRGPGAKILISSSKDGELIARTMGYFGQGAVRGSSNRGGRRAFRALLELSREPVDLVITPDGPKGPRHTVKDGIVQLARISRRPVIPMAFAVSRGHRFASWDRFLLPYPWGQGVYSFGPPVSFTQGETSEAFRARLQTALEDNDRRARAHLEGYGVSSI